VDLSSKTQSCNPEKRAEAQSSSTKTHSNPGSASQHRQDWGSTKKTHFSTTHPAKGGVAVLLLCAPVAGWRSQSALSPDHFYQSCELWHSWPASSCWLEGSV